jgi:hypothetical protein
MPEPVKGEKQSHYLTRFLSSPEAKGSFPNIKQREAVAYALFRREQAKKR